jgi:serine/threonine protein kinase
MERADVSLFDFLHARKGRANTSASVTRSAPGEHSAVTTTDQSLVGVMHRALSLSRSDWESSDSAPGYSAFPVALKNSDLSFISKLSIMLQISSTLDCISQLGIIHRDVKSANVLLLIQGVNNLDFKV